MKIGDKVKIVKAVNDDIFSWNEAMDKFLNQEVTIDFVDFDFKTFCIKEDDELFNFPFECLEESDLDYKIRVMQAFKEGKEIEVYDTNGFEIWNLDKNPTWNWYFYNYRIKETPTLKPFDFSDAEFLISKVVKAKRNTGVQMITKVTNGFVNDMSFQYMLDECTFLDDKPCGKYD